MTTHDEASSTRQRILDAANKVFIAQGFAKASLSEIARQAQVTRGAIYWHFENKNALFVELVEQQVVASQERSLRNTLFAASDPDEPNPLGRLRQWLYLFFSDDEALIIRPALVNIVISILAEEKESDARQRLVEFMEMHHQTLEAALRNAVAHRQLPSDLDIKLAASYLRSICEGQVAWFYYAKREFKRAHYLKMVEVALAHLRELRVRPGSQVRSPLSYGSSHLTPYGKR